MNSSNFEDYEVLAILGIATYKVQSKSNGKIAVWKAISFEEDSEMELLKQIEEQKAHLNRNLVEVYDYIIKEDTGVIYVITEYVANGNLSNIIQKCNNENKYLHEHFLWKVLYQMADVLKNSSKTYLDLNNVFVDENLNVKVLKETTKLKEETNIGDIMQCLSSLQLYEDEVEILSCYSSEFKEMVKFTLLPTYSVKEMVDTILCHPTIYHKSTHVPHMYVDSKHMEFDVTKEITSDYACNYQALLCNLKNREKSLTAQEGKLSSKERQLKEREEKLSLIETSVKEKLLHDVVYLKLCKNKKPLSEKHSQLKKRQERKLDAYNTGIKCNYLYE